MEYSILTRRGGRDLNEDAALVRTDEKGFCCLLADGLGGHSSGEVASRLATETGASLFEKREPEKTETRTEEKRQGGLRNGTDIKP